MSRTLPGLFGSAISLLLFSGNLSEATTKGPARTSKVVWEEIYNDIPSITPPKLPRSTAHTSKPPESHTSTRHDSPFPDMRQYDIMPGGRTDSDAFVDRTSTLPAYDQYKGMRDPFMLKRDTGRTMDFEDGSSYEDAKYHGAKDTPVKNKAPNDPKYTMENSIQIKPSSPTKISYDKNTKEIVILMMHAPNKYHGHVRSWQELDQLQKNILIKHFGFKPTGKPPTTP